jgi:uncharacterized membrane protein YfcA
MLMFAGLDANTANGTNRIGILLQSIVGVASFKKKQIFTFRETRWLVIPSLVGSFFGSAMAANIDKELMTKTISVLMFLLFFVILFQPEKWVREQAKTLSDKPNFLKIVIFFCVGFYAGFIQAGIGVFILASLVLGAGLDLVKANAIKILIILLLTPIALAVFIYHRQVDFFMGAVLGFGNMLGAWVATKFAMEWGVRYIRYLLLLIVFISAIKLMFF